MKIHKPKYKSGVENTECLDCERTASSL